jgi:hypothetical protein
MRILLVLAVAVVFAALLIFDTTALVRLTMVCVTGGCGVPVTWIAIGGGVLALAALISFRRPSVNVKGVNVKGANVKSANVKGANVKKVRVTKVAPSRPARGKAAARRKPK